MATIILVGNNGSSELEASPNDSYEAEGVMSLARQGYHYVPKEFRTSRDGRTVANRVPWIALRFPKSTPRDEIQDAITRATPQDCYGAPKYDLRDTSADSPFRVSPERSVYAGSLGGTAVFVSPRGTRQTLATQLTINKPDDKIIVEDLPLVVDKEDMPFTGEWENE